MKNKFISFCILNRR